MSKDTLGRKWESHPLLHITLIMGAEEGFSDEILEYMSDQAGDYTDSPEGLLIQLEDMMESGELSEEELRQFIEDKRK